MECDVIPTSPQEVDPLGNVEHCNGLNNDDSVLYSQSLNATLVTNADNVNAAPKNRKILNLAPTKSRKLLNVRSSASPPVSHATTVTEPRHSYGSVSESLKKNTCVNKHLLKLCNSFHTQKLQTTMFEEHQASTMREVLASIPGFEIKPRRRTNKKMSTAAQIEQTREGCIDLETPDSILVSFNLRDLLNKDTFSALPPLYQYKLVQLLPSVDRPVIDNETETIRLNSSSLTNEFFTRACLEWKERLADGEFTPENQLKLRTEAEKEKIKLDPWKLKHFEPIWGTKITKTKITNRISSNRGATHKTPATAKANSPIKETLTIVDKVPDVKVKRTSPSTQSAVKHSEMKNKNDLTLRSRPVASYQMAQHTSTSNAKQTVLTEHTDRPSLKTTISFKTIRESQQVEQLLFRLSFNSISSSSAIFSV